MAAIRTRYLVKDPDKYSPHPYPRIIKGEWKRVWAKQWQTYPGEKKMVTGKFILHYVPAERGWA